MDDNFEKLIEQELDFNLDSKLDKLTKVSFYQLRDILADFGGIYNSLFLFISMLSFTFINNIMKKEYEIDVDKLETKNVYRKMIMVEEHERVVKQMQVEIRELKDMI